MTHKYVSKQTIIGSDNGLLPGQHQAIIWTSAGILLNGTLETKFSEILSKIYTFLLRKMHFENVIWKMAAIFLGLNVLKSKQSDWWDVPLVFICIDIDPVGHWKNAVWPMPLLKILNSQEKFQQITFF